MKRTIAMLLLAALLAAVLPTAALAATQSKVYRVSTKVDPLMVHSGPNDSRSTRIASLPRNTALTVLKTSGNWCRVKSFRGVVGWVFKKYITAGATARVDTRKNGLNIRQSAAESAKLLGSAPKGAKVTVKAVSGNWARLTYGKLNGWSSRTYLKWIA